MTDEIALTFEMELLEDLHAGTGAGRLGRIDDTQALDAQGRPVVWASTVRGLLREAAEDWLLARKHAGTTPDVLAGLRARLNRLLGRPATEAGAAIVRSLRLKTVHGTGPNNNEDAGVAGRYCTVWASTAREPHGRRPADETLRFIEYARAGQTFAGEVRLRGDEEDARLLEAWLRRITSLGGGRTRGWGQVRLGALQRTSLGASASRLPDALRGPGPVHLRLLLENLEPLNLARTAYAGNIIDGLGHIPGTTLRGSLLHWLAAQDSDLTARLGDLGLLHVGNAYIIPDEWSSRAADVEVLPLPLTVREPKGGQGVAETTSALPWWARPEEADRLLGRRGERDLAARTGAGGDTMPLPRQPAARAAGDPADHPEAGGGGADYKRIRSEEYLARLRGQKHWHRVRPRVGVLLRNRVPTKRRDPDERSGNGQEGWQDEGFFSQQVLREGQFFVADLRFADAATARQFLAAAAGLLGGPPEQRSWLRVGRGGRPVRVIEAVEPTAGPADGAVPTDRLTLTLTSDLIARTPRLTFRTAIDLVALGELLEAAGESVPPAGGIKVERVSAEAVEVAGYNKGTRLPRAPALAVKRGSFIRLVADPAEPAGVGNLRRWRDALRLAGERYGGLGERLADGHGRFILDLDVHEDGYWTATRPEPDTVPPPAEVSWREEVLEELNVFIKEKWERIEGKDDGRRPSLSPWQWLRERGRLLNSDNAAAALFDDLRRHSQRLAGRRQWQGLADRIAEAVNRLSGPDRKAFFLDELGQEVVARLRRARREGEGDR